MRRSAILALLLPVVSWAQAEQTEIEAGASSPFVPSSAEIEAGAAPSTPSRVRVSGYIDVGLAKAQNNGRGFIIDTADAFRAQFPGFAWRFLGDPWATAINSRGEPADTSTSRAIPHDPVNSEGALTFLVNEVNLDFSASPFPELFLFASLDLLPRTGNRGTLGDFFEIDYAYVDWTPFESVDLTFSAGKFDSAFGREYRLQESPDRPGIVPSLLFRYVGGHPLGVKVRGKFFSEMLVLNVAFTNGSSFIEMMQLADEVDRNDAKTVSGRASVALPLPFSGKLELGASGETGVQSRQTDLDVHHWQVGFDVLAEIKDLELRGEFVRGIAQGGGLDTADGLNYRAFFAEAFFRPFKWAGILARYEERHALHLNTGVDSFLYLIEIQRIVGGLRFDLTPEVIVKLEYVHNRELDPLPQFDNDVMASSLVVLF
jgi:hypothetical protein